MPDENEIVNQENQEQDGANNGLSDVVAIYETRIAELQKSVEDAKRTIADRDKTIILILNGKSGRQQPDANEFYKSLNI